MGKGRPSDMQFISHFFVYFIVCRRPYGNKCMVPIRKVCNVQLETQSANSKYAGVNCTKIQFIQNCPEYFATSTRSMLKFITLYKCKYFRIKIINNIAQAYPVSNGAHAVSCRYRLLNGWSAFRPRASPPRRRWRPTRQSCCPRARPGRLATGTSCTAPRDTSGG